MPEALGTVVLMSGSSPATASFVVSSVAGVAAAASWCRKRGFAYESKIVHFWGVVPFYFVGRWGTRFVDVVERLGRIGR